MTPKIKPKEATAIINSLLAGVVPKIGVQHITVGRTHEVNTVVQALNDTANGHSMVKFWIGDFGSGKSFMLHLIHTVALKQKFVVATADFTPHIRLYSNDGKSQALYTALMNNLAIQSRPEGGALPVLLEKWIEHVITLAADENNIPLVEIRNAEHHTLIQNKLMQTIKEISGVGSFDFGMVVVKYYEAYLQQDDELLKNALKWLCGEYRTKTEAKNDLGVREIICDQNYYNMLKNFGRLFTSIGYKGFVINLDEAVNLYKITNPGMRQKNHEALLSIYNDCFQGKVENLFINIAGTSETLEHPTRGFYSYNALKTRLQVNKLETAGRRDYAQPVIRLMPLDHNEIFVLLRNLVNVFNQNYNTAIEFTGEDIKLFMEEIYNKPGASEFLTPRSVIRDFLNVLNLLRQNPGEEKLQLIREIKVVDERPLDIEEEDLDDHQSAKFDKIKLQCDALGQSHQLAKKLLDVLLENENSLRIVECTLRNIAGVMVLTEKRLMFITKSFDVESFMYTRMSEISTKKGLTMSTLTLRISDNSLSIEMIPNGEIPFIREIIQVQTTLLERRTLAAELLHWKNLISNAKMREHINRMIIIVRQISERDETSSQTFFARHTDTIINLLQQYHKISTSGLQSPDMLNAMKRIEQSVATVHYAFEQELSNMFKSDMLGLDAESAAYLQTLRDRGVIE